MDLTGVTRDRRGRDLRSQPSDQNDFEIMQEEDWTFWSTPSYLSLTRERHSFSFPWLPNTHQQIQLTQVLIHQFGCPRSPSSQHLGNVAVLPDREATKLAAANTGRLWYPYRKRRTPRQYLIPHGDYLPSNYLPVWLCNWDSSDRKCIY